MAFTKIWEFVSTMPKGTLTVHEAPVCWMAELASTPQP
jgi:hypothetical protein